MDFSKKSTNAMHHDCWEHVFIRGLDLKTLSLVCKEFLTVSSNLKKTLKFRSPKIDLLSGLLRRFKNIERIDLSDFCGDMDEALHEIALSDLNIVGLDISNMQKLPRKESLQELGLRMNKLKMFICSNSVALGDTDLMEIVSSFPLLEKLDISHPVIGNDLNPDSVRPYLTDDGIEGMASKLKHLKEINISGISSLSDRSITALSKCASMEVLRPGCNATVSKAYIDHLLCRYSKLLAFEAHLIDTNSLMSAFESTTALPKTLKTLEFYDSDVSDEFLELVAKSSIEIKELKLVSCKKFTPAGLSKIFFPYRQSLTRLKLTRIEFLSNELMDDFTACSPNLTHIELIECPSLTLLVVYFLSNNCPLLQEIQLIGNAATRYEQFKTIKKEREINVNKSVRSLVLGSRTCIGDARLLPGIVSAFINLNTLLFRSTSGECRNNWCCSDGPYTLKYCVNVKEILFPGYPGTRLILDKFQGTLLWSLERLNISRSKLNDEGLGIIVKKFICLRYLNVSNCNGVTNWSVERVVRYCDTLEELDLSGCLNVKGNIVKVLQSRYFMEEKFAMKILHTPGDYVPNKEQKEYLLQKGCVLRHH